jgi:hypothetical protein
VLCEAFPSQHEPMDTHDACARTFREEWAAPRPCLHPAAWGMRCRGCRQAVVVHGCSPLLGLPAWSAVALPIQKDAACCCFAARQRLRLPSARTRFLARMIRMMQADCPGCSFDTRNSQVAFI